MKSSSLHLVFPLALAIACLTFVEANAQSGSRSTGPSFGSRSTSISPQLPSRSFASPSFSAPQAFRSSTRSVRPTSTYTPPTASFSGSRSSVVPTRSRSVFQNPSSVFRSPFSNYSVAQAFRQPSFLSPSKPRSCSSGTCRGY